MGKKVKDLSVNPNNPRTITEEKLSQLGKSMGEFGDISGVVFNVRTGNLGGGNQRSKNFDESSKVVVTKRFDPPTKKGTVAVGYILHQGERFNYREVDWDIDRETAAMIAANKNAGAFNQEELTKQLKHLGSFDVAFDLELTMFDKDELAGFGLSDVTVSEHTRSGPTGVDEDEVPEKAPPKTKPGDIYQLGNHLLLCGDATSEKDVKKLMAGDKAAMVVTSPPYADQRTYNIGEFDWLKLMNGAFDQAIAVSVPDTHLLINLGLSHKNRAVNPYWDPWLKHAEELGWPLFSWYVWDKGFGFPGHHQGRLGPAHEFVFHFNQKSEQANKWVKTNGSAKLRGSKGHRFRNRDGSTREMGSPETHGQDWKIPDSVIRIHREMRRGIHTQNHPAVFPVELPEFLIQTWHGEGDIVYEPFAGSGSTLIACEKTKRLGRAMEIDPHYCDIIVQRWENYTGEKARLVTPRVKVKKKSS